MNEVTVTPIESRRACVVMVPGVPDDNRPAAPLYAWYAATCEADSFHRGEAPIMAPIAYHHSQRRGLTRPERGVLTDMIVRNPGFQASGLLELAMQSEQPASTQLLAVYLDLGLDPEILERITYLRRPGVSEVLIDFRLLGDNGFDSGDYEFEMMKAQLAQDLFGTHWFRSVPQPPSPRSLVSVDGVLKLLAAMPKVHCSVGSWWPVHLRAYRRDRS